jgi:hypothetical protein
LPEAIDLIRFEKNILEIDFSAHMIGEVRSKTFRAQLSNG